MIHLRIYKPHKIHWLGRIGLKLRLGLEQDHDWRHLISGTLTEEGSFAAAEGLQRPVYTVGTSPLELY